MREYEDFVNDKEAIDNKLYLILLAELFDNPPSWSDQLFLQYVGEIIYSWNNKIPVVEATRNANSNVLKNN